MATKKIVKQKVKAPSPAPVSPVAESVAFVRTPGNPYFAYTGDYAALDADGHIIFDPKGVAGVPVKERYEINLEHRPQKRKAGKGMWQISYDAEFGCFKQCRKLGAFEHWQADRHLGYGVFVPDLLFGDKTPQVLGVDLNNADVKVCQFREGNKGIWHGFPFNYMEDEDDYICNNALFTWLRLGIIKKSDIDLINNKEESILS